jgi:DNA adenine methylase
MTVTPPFAYFGGKTTLAPKIASLLPDHDHYVEPFAGSLAVLLAKQVSKFETVNDLDGDLMTFWRVLRDRPADLARVCALTPHSRAELDLAADLDVADEVECARRVWVRLTQSRSHSLTGSGWKYSQHLGINPNRIPHSAYLDAYAHRIEAAAKRLKRVSLECRDAREIIRDYGQHSGVCLYVDPPYLGSARGATISRYRCEMTGDDAHRELADALRACKASVVLSGYASPLYQELFDGWHQTVLKGPPALSGDNDRTEVLWSNRPLGEPTLFEGVGA